MSLSGGRQITIPRHREINEVTAMAIMRDLDTQLGETDGGADEASLHGERGTARQVVGHHGRPAARGSSARRAG